MGVQIAERFRAFRAAFAAARCSALGTITHVTTGEPDAALSFDDGPHPEFTPRLLDILAAHQARATFFMIGRNAQRHPELVRRIAQQGHAVGNHSWDHAIFPLISRRERRSQIRECAKAIAPYANRLFRPPHGYHNLASHLDAIWLGYKVINWNVSVDDWATSDVGRMTEGLVGEIHPGSVVLLHDGLCDSLAERHLDRGPMLTALNTALERLGDRFRFITIPELLRVGQPRGRAAYRKLNMDPVDKHSRVAS